MARELGATPAVLRDTPVSALRNQLCWGSGDSLGSRGLNPGRPCTRLYSDSGPGMIFSSPDVKVRFHL